MATDLRQSTPEDRRVLSQNSLDSAVDHAGDILTKIVLFPIYLAAGIGGEIYASIVGEPKMINTRPQDPDIGRPACPDAVTYHPNSAQSLYRTRGTPS